MVIKILLMVSIKISFCSALSIKLVSLIRNLKLIDTTTNVTFEVNVSLLFVAVLMPVKYCIFFNYSIKSGDIRRISDESAITIFADMQIQTIRVSKINRLSPKMHDV